MYLARSENSSFSGQKEGLDNIDVDYLSAHHIKAIPIDIKSDKNEIEALVSESRINHTFNNFTKIFAEGRKSKPLFQDLCKSRRELRLT